MAKVIQLHQTMRDPKLKGLGVKAKSFRAVKAVGHHHGNVANQAASIPLQHQWKPGITGISPQGPQARFWTFREFPRVVLVPWPVKVELKDRPLFQQFIERLISADPQRTEIKTADGFSINQNWIHEQV